MIQTPIQGAPYRLRFRDKMGEYEAEPFFYEDGRWIKHGKYDIEAQGEVVKFELLNALG